MAFYCVAFIVARKWSETDLGRLVHGMLNLWLILTWSQPVIRIEQKVVLLVELGDLSWDAHRTQVHGIEIVLIVVLTSEPWNLAGWGP